MRHQFRLFYIFIFAFRSPKIFCKQKKKFSPRLKELVKVFKFENSQKHFTKKKRKNLSFLFSLSFLMSSEVWIECGVCTETLRDPRVLPCGHTFCMECILQIKSFQCPLCRVPFMSAETLPKNFIVLSWLEEQHHAVHSNGGNEKKENEVCCVCEKAFAVWWCETCAMHTDGFLCEKCDIDEHSGRVTKLHQRITMQERIKKTQLTQKCATHQSKCKIYCNDCRRLICQMCLFDSHKDHSATTLQKHAEVVRGEMIERDLGRFEETMNFLENVKMLLGAEKEESESEVMELVKRVNGIKDKVEVMVNEMMCVDEQMGKIGVGRSVMLKVIEQMDVLELVDGGRVNEMKGRISRLIKELCESEMMEKFKKFENEEKNKRRNELKMNRISAQGNAMSYSISEDGMTLLKTQMGCCSISSIGVVPQWRVRYLHNVSSEGWLFIGIHCDPAHATEKSYRDRNCFGVNVSLDTNNSIWKAGISKLIKTMTVSVGDVMCVEVVADQFKIQKENGAWFQIIDLPPGRTWYPHFNSPGASFRLLA